MRNNLFNKVNDLQVLSFIAKDNLGLAVFSIEPTIVKLRKRLYPKEFKTVSKHLVRIK